MSQIASIFEKVKENFNNSFPGKGTGDEYELIFAPFSTGFTEDDFLFLNTDNAAEHAHKYYDELLEFSIIANTIPENDNFWTVSAQTEDYLYTKYKNLLQRLKLLDTETLKIDHLYPAAIFQKALAVISPDPNSAYNQFYQLFRRLSEELAGLKNTSSPDNNAAALEISLKEEALRKTVQEWKEKGDKDLVESKILQLIKDEFKNFLLTLDKVRGNVLEPSVFVREHAGNGVDFYLTSCSPNNLYQSDDLSWKKIKIPKTELQQLLKSKDIEKYNEILGNPEVDKLDIDEINFDLLFVHVVRGWFEDGILDSPFWNCLVLDKETIEIPCFTSSLIFIRNVEITLAENSGKNKQAIKSPKVANLGPFIMHKAQLKKANTFRLHSVNKSLAIDRGTVLNVLSHIPEKQKIRQVKPSKIIRKKQQQFLRLAPRLKKNNFRKKTVLSAKILRPFVFKKPGSASTPKVPPKAQETAAENSTTVHELQLIGVVAQKVKHYPNPIKGADYI